MAQTNEFNNLVTIRITVRIQESVVRNPHSLDYRKNYQRIIMKFYGELGCSPETNSTDYILVSIRKFNPLYCQNPFQRTRLFNDIGLA